MTDLATLAIRVDASQGTAQVLNFGKASETAAGGVGILEQSAASLERTMARVRVIFGLGLFGFKFLDETIAAQDAMAQLEAGVASTGMAAGKTARQLGEQAAALQDLSTFSDEAIAKTESILLLYENLSGVNFDRATQSAADLAARLGTDIPDASRQLGRALEAPEEGLSALRRAGVVFTQAQKDVIIELDRAGKSAEAQSAILDVLEQKLGGSALAARNTLGGALKGLKNDFGDLFESTREGSQGIITVINAVDTGVEVLGEHMDELKLVGEALAAVMLSKQVTAFSAYVERIQQGITGTTLAAAAEVRHTAALTTQAAAAARAAQFEVQLAEAVLFNARAHEQCAFTEAERTTTMAALTAAETRYAVATEAATASTIALTNAQIAEAAASANAARVATVTGVVMTRVAGLARAAWAAIGGPIGAIILGLVALKYAWDKYFDSVNKAAKLTDEQQKAYEKALASERARNTAIRQSAERQAEADAAAKKANAERSVEIAKLATLNAHYRDSAVALKILEIELSANIDKVKAHKEAKQAEWEAIDRSIDALTRQQVIAVKLNDQLERETRLRGMQRGDADAIKQAQQALQLSRLDEDTQSRRRIEMDLANKLEAARLDFAEQTLRATDDQVITAQQIYDSTVKRAKVEADVAKVMNEERIALEKMNKLIEESAKIGALKNEQFERDLEALEQTRKIQEDVKNDVGSWIEGFFGSMRNGSEGFWQAFKNAGEQALASLIAKKVMSKVLDLGAVQGFLDTLAKRRAAEASGIYSKEMLDKGFPVGNQRALGAGAAALSGAFAGYNVGAGAGSRTGAALGGALAGAASGAVIGSSILPGLGTALGAGIGATAGLIAGLIGFNQTAQATKGELAAMRSALELNLQTIRATVTGQGQLGLALAKSKAEFDQLRDQTEKALGGKSKEQEREQILRELNSLEALRAKQLEDEVAQLKQTFGQELQVRNLRAAGLTQQADALAQQLANERELAEARKQFGNDAAEVMALALTQAEEAKRRTEDLAEANRRASQDLGVRGLAASGGSTRAVEDLRFAIGQERELADLRKTSASPEVIAQLEQILALEKAARDAALADQNKRAQEDLAVRLLAAEGHTQEAEDLRFLIDQQREYNDAVKAGLDEATLAALALAQAAESAQRAADKAKSDARALEDLGVRGLAATGQTKAADDLRFALDQARELEEARATKSQEFIDKLIEVQRLERENRALTQSDTAIAATQQALALRDAKNVVVRDSQALSETTGNRMADYLNSINIHENESVFYLRSIDAKISGGIPGGFSGDGTLSVNVTIQNINVGDGQTVDTDDLADKIGRVVDQRLGKYLKRAVLTVTPKRN